MSTPEKIVGVVVTHKRRELLAESLKVLSTQSRPLDHLVVIDNADEDAVRELVEGASLPTSYIGSKHNLGGAGGFALGILYALSLGADRVWLADDDGRPEGPEVLETLLACALRHDLAEVSPSSATSTIQTAWHSHCAAAPPGDGCVVSWAPRISCPGSRLSSTAHCSPPTPSTPSEYRIFDCSSAATKWKYTAGSCDPA